MANPLLVIDGPAVLYRNDGGDKNNYLSIRLKGKASALGAVARVTTASGRQWQTVHSGSSYCSQSDLALVFGLAQQTTAAKVEIEWPSGKKQVFDNVKARQHLEFKEP